MVAPPIFPTGYNNQALLLSEQEAKSEDNAMNYLRMALKKSPEVSPQQGWAAALLAAIPTFGGYLIGESVGPADIPEGFYGADLTKYATGGAQGGAQGAAVGASAAGGYLQGLEADQAQANDVYTKMATVEANKAQRLGSREDALIQAGLGKQAEMDMIPIREASQYRLQENAAENAMERQKRLEDYKDKRGALPPEILQREGLTNPDGTPLNTEQVRSITAWREANRKQQGQDYRQGQSILPGYKNVSKAELTPNTVAELEKQNFGIAKTNQLIDQYLATPDSFTGDPSAIQAAIQGMLVNAQRQATGSGANFTATEMALVSQALPAAQAGNLDEWIKRNALGRDQKIFAQTLKGLYQKTQDYALAESYGQLREDVPITYYPPKILNKWGISSGGAGTKEQALARINELLAKAK